MEHDAHARGGNSLMHERSNPVCPVGSVVVSCIAAALGITHRDAPNSFSMSLRFGIVPSLRFRLRAPRPLELLHYRCYCHAARLQCWQSRLHAQVPAGANIRRAAT